MTKEILKAQNDILRKAWREGALNDVWYNKWVIKEIYEQQAKNLQQPDVIKSVSAKEFKTGGYCPVCFKEKMQCICTI